MRKKTIVNIFHYAVKYLIILLPIIFLCFSMFLSNSDYTVDYDYFYQTNEVNSNNDLVAGNYYLFDLSNVSDILVFNNEDSSLLLEDLHFTNDLRFNIIYNVADDSYSENEPLIYNSFIQFLNVDNYDSVYIGLEDSYYIYDGVEQLTFETENYNYLVCKLSEFNNPNANLYTLFSILPDDYKVISSVVDNDLNTTIYHSVYNFFDYFRNMPINSFYNDMLETMQLNNIDTHTPLGLMSIYPLWIMWVYILDLLLDIMLFIPRLAHKWIEKGTQND